MIATQRYFVLQQDRKFDEYIGRGNLSRLSIDWNYDQPIFCLEDATKSIHDRFFNPFIEAKSIIVSGEIKRIFDEHCLDLLVRPCILGVMGKLPQQMHYAILPERLDCLSSYSEYNSIGQIKRIVLNQHKIGPNRVFLLGGIAERRLIVNLEVLEQIMDAACFPILYQEVETLAGDSEIASR